MMDEVQESDNLNKEIRCCSSTSQEQTLTNVRT
jgi:hypothetical protein